MSKFNAIRDLLRAGNGVVEISMDELSDAVDGGLPRSAYRWEVWWCNDDDTHTQSRAWGDAGYDAQPDLSSRTVRFVPKPR